jgi:hypothetical protein
LALKYKDTDDAIRKHVSYDDKRQQGSLISNPGKSPGLKTTGKNTTSEEDKSDKGSNPLNSRGLKGIRKKTTSEEDKSDLKVWQIRYSI